MTASGQGDLRIRRLFLFAFLIASLLVPPPIILPPRTSQYAALVSGKVAMGVNLRPSIIPNAVLILVGDGWSVESGEILAVDGCIVDKLFISVEPA